VPEPTRTLHDTLAELHRQLERSDARDPALREELRAALEEIRARVEAGESPERPALERISELMLRLEAAHPAIAGPVGAVVRALARMGI
jgi:hypothetical protein